MTLPTSIRRRVAAVISNRQARDQVLAGYDGFLRVFWLVCVDEQGVIDHEFVEPMTPDNYRLLAPKIARLVERRGGAVRFAGAGSRPDNGGLH